MIRKFNSIICRFFTPHSQDKAFSLLHTETFCLSKPLYNPILPLLQLIIRIEFNQAIKLHSLKLQAPVDKGPKTIKVFQNLPQTLDFDSADSNAPVQTLE